MFNQNKTRSYWLKNQYKLCLSFSLFAGLFAAYTFDDALSYAVIAASFNKSDAQIFHIEKNPYNPDALSISYSFMSTNNSMVNGSFVKRYINNPPKLGDKLTIVYSGFSDIYNDRYEKHIGKRYRFYLFLFIVFIILLTTFLFFRTAKEIQHLKKENEYF